MPALVDTNPEARRRPTMADMIFCTKCGRLNQARSRYCLACGTPRELNNAQRVAGIAFLLNEIQLPLFEGALTDQQTERIERHYEQQLEALTGRPVRVPAAEEPVVPPPAAVSARVREWAGQQPASVR